MTDYLVGLYVLIIGAVMGSFLGSLIYRASLTKSTSRLRSYCPDCKHTLGALDLIPVVSFLSLGGRCRYCKMKIHPRYLLIEVTSAVVYLLTFFLFLNQNLPLTEITLLYYLAVSTILIGLFFSDLFFGILPDKMIMFGLGVTLTHLIYQYLLSGQNDIINHLLSAIASGAFFLTTIVVTKGRGMGGGDMKLAFWIGLLLGWPSVFSALFLAFLTGSILSVMLIMIRVKRFGQTIPFGPFLVVCTYISLFWGDQIFNWYLGLTAR